MHSVCSSLLILALALPVNAVSSSAIATAPADAAIRRVPRIRPYDLQAEALLREGRRRSDTVRSLIDRIEQSDVIVYVQFERRLKSRLAGSLTWLAGTKNYRYVRISLTPGLRGDSAIAVLGHELQHAVEVAEEPSIVDDASLREYYQRTGIAIRIHINGWDTEAARMTGDEVRRELADGRDTGH